MTIKAPARARKYLRPAEIDQLLKVRFGRYPERNHLLILLTYRHGLRISEAVSLTFEQVDCQERVIQIFRVKNGTGSIHPLSDEELALISALPGQEGHIFLSERGTPLTTRQARRVIVEAGARAGITVPVHPHMLRHSCGFKLINSGVGVRHLQNYLGHRNIQHTMLYSELDSNAFKGLEKVL